MIVLPRASLCVLAAAAGLWAMCAEATPPPTPPVNGGNGGKIEDTVRCVSLPRAKGEDPLDLYVARTKAKLPSAVLILFVEKGQDVKALLGNPGWQNFAEDYSLGLVAIALTAGPALVSKNAQPPSAQSQASLALQAVDHEFGGLPLLLYSGPQQAAFAQTLLAANPKRVASWCLRAPAHLVGIDNVTGPPGIVVCQKENKPIYDALTEDFARARKKGARLSWVALAGDKPSTEILSALDSFVRKYMAAVLAAKPGMDGWENIDTKLTASVADLNSHPEHGSYLPHVSLASAWATLHVPGKPELAQLAIAEREEDTFNKAQPKLHLYLRKPLSAEKTGGRIEGVLAFCTWKKEKEALVGRLQNKDDFLVRYAEEHRLALLTWDTAQAWSTKESADQRSQQENFRDDQGFDKLATAWERGVHVLCHDAGLPENDFLLYGMSRGAQWAHRLALRKPEHFLAVHIHINSSYDWPTPAAKNILWLQTTGDREAGYEAAKRFYARCREMGYPIIFKAGENLGHSDSAQIDKLGLRFFDYALGMKIRRDTAMANFKPSRGKHTGPSLYELSGLDDAPFYADFINQDVYQAAEKDMVPASQRVPLPTEALARAWGSTVEAPSLLAVSNPVMVPTRLSSPLANVHPSTTGPANGFGPDPSPSPSPAANASAATAPVPAANASKQEDRATPPPTSQSFTDRYRQAVQKAVVENPALAQEGSTLNEAFLGRYHRLKDSNDALLADPTWPEQVARLVREQMNARPDFAWEFNASVERAVLAYPTLAQADSPMNAAFLVEYRRLKAAGDALLTDSTWPEQVARTVSAKLANP